MRPVVVIGLGFGDEGKGMAVAHETERVANAGLVPINVRFNGGPQAAHNVRVVRDGKVLHHTHSQFGSGTMLGAETVLARGMLFDPLSLVPEAEHLARTMGTDVMRLMSVDGGCPVVLPTYAMVNRLVETRRGDARHGSTGRGIGIARWLHEHGGGITVDMLDCLEEHDTIDIMERDVEWLESRFDVSIGMDRSAVADEFHMLRRCVDDLCGRGMGIVDARELVRGRLVYGNAGVVFEGSQGVMLDERVGYFPHVTYGDMSASGAVDIVAGARVMGVTRTYHTRHGAGPLRFEGSLDAKEPDNGTYEWAGSFRTALLCTDELERAARLIRPDEVAVSHMDRFPGAYMRKDGTRVECDERELVGEIETACDAGVTVMGRGPLLSDWKDAG